MLNMTSKEYYELLKKDFPKLYEPQPYCGVYIPAGWRQMIYDLSKELSDTGDDIVVAQVKEKFGGLRFYVDQCSMNNAVSIDRVERESYAVCAVCGEVGELRRLSWIAVLCDKHYAENKKDQ